MTEIKGQLLGIVLLLMVFGIAGGVLLGTYYKLSEKVETQVEQIVSDNYITYEVSE